LSKKETSVFWFTGRSGAGKTTIVAHLVQNLKEMGKQVRVFDGDIVRKEINPQLTFTPEDIKKNNQIVSKLCLDNLGLYDYIFVPLISPFEESREQARSVLGKHFCLVYVRASLQTVMQRDTKGLYRRAFRGEVRNFIGVDPQVPFEEPAAADLVIDTEREDIATAVGKVMNFIQSKEGQI